MCFNSITKETDDQTSGFSKLSSCFKNSKSPVWSTLCIPAHRRRFLLSKLLSAVVWLLLSVHPMAVNKTRFNTIVGDVCSSRSMFSPLGPRGCTTHSGLLFEHQLIHNFCAGKNDYDLRV